MRALGFFLALIFLSPVVLWAEAPGGDATALPKVKTYGELRRAISQARAASRVRIEKAVEQERVREAWEIGRLIDAHVLQHKERAGYDQQVLVRLAGDLGMSKTELYYMLEFARAYPIFRHAGKLPWSDQEILLAVNDPRERQALAERAEKENWSRDRLREEVRALKGAGTVAPDLLLSQPGKPGTYRVILAKAGPYAGELAIDLGFSNYVRLAEIVEDASPFNEGDLVVSSRDTKGSYQLSAMSSRPEDLFTYRAYVYRALDGDTIEAVVDLGFGITTTQILRLRGIDAPEIKTRDGMEAKAFLEQKLRSAVAETQEKSPVLASGLSAFPILIRTVKSDKYDRYLADVFLTEDPKGEEVYLNNLLLEKGMAVRAGE